MVGFSKKREPIMITVNLNMRLQPKDREILIDKPFEAFLLKRKLGKLISSRSYLADNGSVEGYDFQIELDEHAHLATVMDELNALGAAKGSSIQIDETITPFGDNEGLALFLDRRLPENITAENSLNALYLNIERALSGQGAWLSTCKLEHEFALFFYGRSFVRMRERLQALFSKEPLLQNARIERIA